MKSIKGKKLKFVLLLLYTLAGCKKSNYFKEVRVDHPEPESADIVIHKFTADGYKSGKSNWNLSSDVAFISYSTDKIKLNNLKVIYHGTPGETTAVISKTGELDRKTNNLVLQGEVNVKSSNGRTLKTEELFWNSKKEELSTNQNVLITYPNGERVKGSGMKSDGSLRNIVIYDAIGIHPAENE